MSKSGSCFVTENGVPKADKVNAKRSDYLVPDMAVTFVYKMEDNAKIQPAPVASLI